MNAIVAQQLLIAVGVAAAVSATAWRLGALSATGAIAATVVGAIVFGAAGFGAAVVLVLFFTSSSALSALPPATERARRGGRQVLANGSVAAAAAALIGYWPDAAAAFLGATAAATADTWATEIGVRLGKRPRSILTLRPQRPGASGAVSLAGSVAAALGALAVASVGYWLMGEAGSEDRGDGSWLWAVAVAGWLGALLDSVLGAGPQAQYRCAACGARPEVARHPGCSQRADRVSGLRGLDNDAVNWVASLAGAAGGLALLRLG